MAFAHLLEVGLSRKLLASRGGIYKISHIASGRAYVGSSHDLWRRFGSHISTLRSGKHRNARLMAAWRKHGEKAFHIGVLEYVEIKQDLFSREQYWMDRLRAVERRHGFNLAPQAGSVVGVPRGPETSAKVSAALTGRKRAPFSEEHLANLRASALTRAPMSPLGRANLSAALRGHRKPPFTEEHRKNLSASLRRRYGPRPVRQKKLRHPHSEETRAKIAASLRGRKLPENVRAKCAAALRGRPVSAETRAKIGAANLGRVRTIEDRLKISKLTVENVAAIRRRLACGEGLTKIAVDFAVTKQLIWNIKERRIWKDLP